MCNIYLTSEPEIKLKLVFSNLKNFFILDVNAFVEELGVDLTRLAGIYLVNSEIEKTILSLAKLKKYQGVIYINRNLSKNLHDFFKQKFKLSKLINKIILIDNGLFPLHPDLMGIFDEVVFYERFKKNKIIECHGFDMPIEENIANPDKFLQLLDTSLDDM